MSRLSLGQHAEKVAANFLLAQGYEVIDAHYYNPSGYHVGEIDLVAKEKDDTIVFVEVKARKGKKDEVVPEENITPDKIVKLTKIAQKYLQENNLLESNWRIDAVSIIFDFDTRKMDVRQIKNIRL